MTRRGFTILEACVSTLILSLLVMVIFGVFQFGSRSFQTLVLRQGIQSEARRIAALMRRDLLVTSYQTVTTLDRTSPATPAPLNERDAISFATLDDWNNQANYDMTRKPRWNRFLAWYATTLDPEELAPWGRPELGQLLRKEVTPVSPSPPMSFSIPMTNPTLGVITASPAASSDVYSVLSRNVLHFSVRTDAANENVVVHLVLREQGIQSATGMKRQVETFECFFDMRPENTWPSD